MLEKHPEEINLIFKHFPLPNHTFARQAALAALAASRQGKYQELTAVFLKNSKNLSNENIRKYAEEVGLDMEQYAKDYADPALKAIINQDMALARKINVRGVPAVFINGKAMVIRSFSSIIESVEKEINKIK